MNMMGYSAQGTNEAYLTRVVFEMHLLGEGSWGWNTEKGGGLNGDQK